MRTYSRTYVPGSLYAMCRERIGESMVSADGVWGAKHIIPQYVLPFCTWFCSQVRKSSHFLHHLREGPESGKGNSMRWFKLKPSWRWLIQHRTAPTFTGHLRHLEANFNNGEVAISAGIRNKHFVSEKGNKSSPILQSYIRRLWLKYLPFISSLESWICDGIKRDRGEPRSVTLETRNTLLGTLRKNKIPIALFLNRSVFLTT